MTARRQEARRRAERRGRIAERVAEAHYLLRGYQTLHRRFRSAGGEIDLVMRRGDTLAFVEVKTRQTLDDAVFAVTPKARRRIESAARQFIAQSPAYAAYAVRYDILAVAGLSVRRLEDAWRAEPRRV